jgi:hypothetical protein
MNVGLPWDNVQTDLFGMSAADMDSDRRISPRCDVAQVAELDTWILHHDPDHAGEHKKTKAKLGQRD